ncbi:MAG: hypothetical protein HY761_03370 [Candidatus Omnitrophica bacterium]|nr:hypothetical protein [Candidatus Omnitrophota bacterium]
MKRIFLLATLAVLVFSGISSASNLDANCLGIHSPGQLAGWLKNEFKYRAEMPDKWQSAEETFKLKKGDCEDFAIISQKILGDLGIKAQILVIKFKGIVQSHAVCIFKQDRYYNFISNQKIVYTKAVSVKEAISECYPDWERIIYTDAGKLVKKIAARTKENIASPELINSSLKEE